MRKIRAGLYIDVAVHETTGRHVYVVERLTPDVSSETGWAFAIDGSELSEPYATKADAEYAARATIFGGYR
jgi:hypothetical protein